MANVLVEEASLQAIADAIRTQNGGTATYKPAEMAPAILALEGGEGGGDSGGTTTEAVLEAIEITENGTYTPRTGVDGFSSVTVNVDGASHTELEYLETDGGQYINTGILPSSTTKVEIRVRRDAFSDQALLGSRKSSSSSDRFAIFMSESTVAHCQFYNKSYDVDVSDMTGVDVVATLSKDGYYYDDTLITAVPTTAWTSSYPLYLFLLNQANAINRPIAIRFYHCKIWQDDVLVRDFVPVNLAGVGVCLYDAANDRYYFNWGSGDFVAGPTKE